MPRPPQNPKGRRHQSPAPLVVGALALFIVLLLPGTAWAEDGDPQLQPGSAVQDARALVGEHLRTVTATSTELTRVERQLVALEQTILTNRAVRDQANAALVQLGDQRETERQRITTHRQRRLEAGERAARHRSELAELAVAAYVGGRAPIESLPLDAATANSRGHQHVLVGAVDTTLRERLTRAEADIAAATAQVDQGRAELNRLVAEIEATTAQRDAAEAELARAEPALPRVQEQYRDTFMVATVDGADFSVVAYDAYRTAASTQPSCQLSWTILAGIGRVESRHGTYRGARPQADGTTSPRIIGIPLDGGPGVAHIADTDGGALDGDPVYDRAVGPMQFIPSTWRMVQRDGNGDGRMDPHNLYDAAAAAAAYLCRSGNRLDQSTALNRAILSYNQSQTYVDAVLGHHRSYGRLGLN